ncbi:hypothetical protein I7I50_01097 [Histoplasma capsulatum G186AR]|uniref:Uncharacterized protein n=1 Tax=Ajellomyces capsulatus TaxID=5037 RepID=A0A8H7YXB5_AJECA|nr:hypothetical protein I7I52_09081 [Histoplasma capsulatum]QSS73066.1 hypothetical protein I7I50_01097 [Histoplasma capsulatum G186AR]
MARFHSRQLAQPERATRPGFEEMRAGGWFCVPLSGYCAYTLVGFRHLVLYLSYVVEALCMCKLFIREDAVWVRVLGTRRN